MPVRQEGKENERMSKTMSAKKGRRHEEVLSQDKADGSARDACAKMLFAHGL
jgi:hypothetical protein